MTHKPEADIEPAVAAWFRDAYGDDAVETQVYLPAVRWFCDIVVEVGFARLYVEVESRASAVRNGIAQAAGYAGADPIGTPIVVTPRNHIDAERRDALRSGAHVLIREFDTDRGQFVSES